MDHPSHKPFARTRFALDQQRTEGQGGGRHLVDQTAVSRAGADKLDLTESGAEAFAHLAQLGPEPVRWALGRLSGGVETSDEPEQTDQPASAIEQR
jgi:hypothetical protein